MSAWEAKEMIIQIVSGDQSVCNFEPKGNTLNYSHDAHWTKEFKGKEIADFCDTDNGIDITMGDKLIGLDYAQRQELHAILLMYQDSRKGLNTYEFKKYEEVK